MSERAARMADQFAQLNTELIATVEACSAAQWATTCADTGWSVAVQAHHIADIQGVALGFMPGFANGEPIPSVTSDDVDAHNARHAARFSTVSREATAALLRENGVAMRRFIADLTDAQLAQTSAFGGAGALWNLERLVAYLPIGEIERHGGYLRQAIAPVTGAGELRE